MKVESEKKPSPFVQGSLVSLIVLIKKLTTIAYGIHAFTH
jgi:hypothetical protein